MGRSQEAYWRESYQLPQWLSEAVQTRRRGGAEPVPAMESWQLADSSWQREI